MRYLALFVFLLSGIIHVSAQNLWNIDTISAPANLENIIVKRLGSDSLSTANIIFIKKELKPHHHATHSEQAYILEGTAEMQLGDKHFTVKKGDIIFIPKGTIHAVKTTSTIPLKVLAVQSPYSDGTDRVLD